MLRVRGWGLALLLFSQATRIFFDFAHSFFALEILFPLSLGNTSLEVRHLVRSIVCRLCVDERSAGVTLGGQSPGATCGAGLQKLLIIKYQIKRHD